MYFDFMTLRDFTTFLLNNWYYFAFAAYWTACTYAGYWVMKYSGSKLITFSWEQMAQWAIAGPLLMPWIILVAFLMLITGAFRKAEPDLHTDEYMLIAGLMLMWCLSPLLILPGTQYHAPDSFIGPQVSQTSCQCK